MKIPALPLALMLIALAGVAGCDRPGPEKPAAESPRTETASEAVADIGAPAAAGLQITDAHMPEPPPGVSMGAIYLVLENTQPKDRQLLLLETDVAGSAQLHRTSYEEGTMKMRHVPHLALPAGQTIRFEPGGYHVMLMQLDERVKVGTRFDLRLTFDGGEVVTADVEVRKRQ